ncbi:MAG: hypothetical protein HY959_01980 [Ignavibacteriae bacterium]|nr:hypothetical protein [Ignavibacteriota bacterium]
MKTFIVLLIAFFTLSSCGLIKNLTGSKEETKEEKPEKKEQLAKEEKQEEKNVSQGNTSTGGSDEIIMKDFDKNDLPSDVKYQGSIFNGKRWSDKNGENIIILTTTKEHSSGTKGFDGEFERSKELYGYQYVKKSDGWSQLWKINDFIEKCPLDLTLEFIGGSLSVTDLNKNGIGETTFLYKMTCRGDVSPCDMKLIMHEGETKYAIRGVMKMYVDNRWYGGDYKVDKSFNDAPSGFLDYAKEQWNKFKTEKLN